MRSQRGLASLRRSRLFKFIGVSCVQGTPTHFRVFIVQLEFIMPRTVTKTAQPTKTASASRKVAKPVDVQRTEASHEVNNEPNVGDRLRKAIDDWCAENEISMNRRTAIGFVVGVVIACGVGFALAPLINALAVATMLVSTSVFLGVLVYILGVVLVGFAGGTMANIACTYVTSGKAEAHFSSAKTWVSGLFGRKTVVTQS